MFVIFFPIIVSLFCEDIKLVRQPPSPPRPLFFQGSLYEGLHRLYPDSYDPDRFTTEHSGKLLVVSRMLSHIHGSDERVVLISNYTQVSTLLLFWSYISGVQSALSTATSSKRLKPLVFFART